MIRPRAGGAAVAAAALVAALLAGPAARADRVRVEVSGVSGERRSNVLGLLGIDDAGDPAEAEVRHLHARAAEEIARALEPFGHYRPRIDARLERSGAGWVARYRIDPGPPVRLDTVDVRVRGPGADDPEFQRLAADFPLEVGDPLLHARYRRGREAFARQAARGGYLDGRFDTAGVRVDLERYAAALALHFDTGPRFRFGPVRFESPALGPRLLEGYVRFRRGDPFDYEALLRLQEALLASDYFRAAEIVPRRDLAEDLEVPIEVRLVPHQPRRLSWGVGYGTDEGASARAALELRRLNRRGHRAEIEGTLAEIERSVSAQYRIPWTRPHTDVLTFSAGASDLRPATSRSRRLVAGAALRRQVGNWTRTGSLSFDRDRFEVGADRRTSSFLVPAAHASYLVADDRVFTTSGHRLDLDVRGSATPLGDASFLRLLARGAWIASPAPSRRVLLRAEGGTTWTDDFGRLPPTLRFFAGGARSVRGFEFQGVGPRGPEGAVIGGPHLVVGSLEIDQRVVPGWRVAAFYDAGGALFRRGDPLEDAAGLGLRWISPVGPVRVDLAVPLHEAGSGVRFHLALGPDL